MLTNFIQAAETFYNLPIEKANTKIEKLSSTLDLLGKKLDNATNSAKKAPILIAEFDNELKKIRQYETAELETVSNLEKAREKILGLDNKKSTANAVASNKELDLSKYKENSAEWFAAQEYNIALKALTDATNNLNVAEQEYIANIRNIFDQLYNLPLDDAAEKIEKVNKALDLFSKKLDNAFNDKQREKYLREEIAAQKEILEANRIAAKETKKNLKDAQKQLVGSKGMKSPKNILLDAASTTAITEEQRESIRQSVANKEKIDTTGITDKELLAYIEAWNKAIEKNEEAVYNNKVAQQEYLSSIKSLSEQLANLPVEAANEKLSKLSDQLTLLSKRLENAFKSSKKLSILYKELAKEQQTLATAQKKYADTSTNRDIATTNLLGSDKFSTLSKDQQKAIKNRIASGKELDVTQTKDKDLIALMSEYNAMLKEDKQALYDLNIAEEDYIQNIRNIYEQIYNMPLDKLEEKLSKISDALGLLDKQMSNAIGLAHKNRLINKEAQQAQKEYNALLKAQEETQKNFDKAGTDLFNIEGMNKAQKKAVKKALNSGTKVNTDMFEIGSDARKAAEAYNKALDASYDANLKAAEGLEDFNRKMVELSKQKFDNIADKYSKRIQIWEEALTGIQNGLAKAEASGNVISNKYYTGQKSVIAKENSNRRTELDKLTAQLAKIPAGTEEWYAARQEIVNLQKEINDGEIEIMKLNNSIVENTNANREWLKNEYARRKNEIDFLTGLKDYEDTANDKTGTMNDAGYARLYSGTAALSYDKAAQKETQKRLNELLSMRDNGTWNSQFNSESELGEEISKIYDELQGDVKAVYDDQKAIYDQMESYYNAQLSYVKEEVSLRKEALQNEKDAYSYQKTLLEKTQNINSLQNQIAAYSGNDSQEAMATLQKLNADLADAQKDLEETEWEHALDVQEKMLDDMTEELEQVIETLLDNFEQVVKTGMEEANKHAADSSMYLGQIAKEYGYNPQYGSEIVNDGSESIQNSVKNSVAAIAKGAKIDKTDADYLAGQIVDGNKQVANETIDVIKSVEADDNTKQDATVNTFANAVGEFEEAIRLMPGEPAVKNPTGGTTTIKSDMPTPVDITKPDQAKGKQGMPSTKDVVPIQSKALSSIEWFESFIRENGKKPTKKKSEYSELNQKLMEKYGLVIGTTAFNGILSKFGIKSSTWKKDGNLYKYLKNTLKVPGFAHGGLVDILKRNGDDGIATLKVGESVLTPIQTQAFIKLADNLDTMDMMTNLVPKLANLDSIAKANTGSTYGDINYTIDLPNVVDTQTFITELQKPKVQKVLQSVTVDRLNGGGRLSSRSIK